MHDVQYDGSRTRHTGGRLCHLRHADQDNAHLDCSGGHGFGLMPEEEL